MSSDVFNSSLLSTLETSLFLISALLMSFVSLSEINKVSCPLFLVFSSSFKILFFVKYKFSSDKSVTLMGFSFLSSMILLDLYS